MIARRILALMVLVLGFLPIACHQITDYSPQPQTVNKALVAKTTITVTWVRDVDEILKLCPKSHTIYGCADGKHDPQDWNHIICTVFAVQPKDFNDVPVLAVLGHEAWHCFGAAHL